jgi:hypothetical protein
MRKRFTFLAVCACILFSLPSFAQNIALKLNGSNFVQTTSRDILNYPGGFTIEFWAYIAAMDGNIHQFVSEGTGLGGFPGAFYLGYDGATGEILLGDSWGPTGIQMPVAKWTHIAVVYDENQQLATLFLNGKAQVTSFFIYSSSTSGQVFQIGVQTDGSQSAVAKIDDMKTWNVQRSAFNVKRDMFSDPDPADVTLQTWYKLDDNNQITVLNSATVKGSSMDGVINGDGPGPSAPNSWTWSPIQTSSNGLTFLGSENDQVVIPGSTAYDNIFNGTTNAGTIEFWVNPSSLSPTTFSTVLGKFGQYSIQLSTTKIRIDNGTATPLDLTLPTDGDFAFGFPTLTWSHLAFVYDGAGTTSVYYNGLYLDQILGPMGTPVANQPLTLGVAKDNTGVDSKPFTGGIDEVRFWNAQQSPADIFNNYNNTLSGTENNLISQFTFDQGVPDQDNTGMTTAFDNVLANNGALNNFRLTGTASNYNLHTLTTIPVPLPVILTKFTAQRNGTEALLKWQTAQEQNTRDFTIERSTDGKTYTTIGVVAAAGNSNNPLDYSFSDLSPEKTSNYYRLKQSDLDGKFTYSPVRLLNFGTTGNLIWYNTGKQTAVVYLQQGNNEMYTLTDISGHILSKGQLSGGKTQVSNLPAGIYIVTVVTSKGNPLTTRVLLY